MTGKNVLAGIAILLALTVNTAFAEYDVAKYCQLVKIGTKFPSFDSCQSYYVCGADGYTNASCLPNETFDKDVQLCVPSSTVECNNGFNDPCSISNQTFVTDVYNCKGFIVCKDNVEIARGNCPENQHFNEETLSCHYGTCKNEIEDKDSDVSVCDIMASNTFFGSFDDCNKWNKCVEGKAIPGSCNGDLVYNVEKGMCLKDDGTTCSRFDNNAPTDRCTTDEVKGDEKICSVYYECKDEKWTKQQCSNQQYYNNNNDDTTTTEYCAPRNVAKATNGCNRCEYATKPWVNVADDPNKFLVCDNGSIIYEGTCPKEYIFDEEKQGCIKETKTKQRR